MPFALKLWVECSFVDAIVAGTIIATVPVNIGITPGQVDHQLPVVVVIDCLQHSSIGRKYCKIAKRPEGNGDFISDGLCFIRWNL